MPMTPGERVRLRPEAGARLLLELEAGEPGHAQYLAWVLVADGEHGYRARLDANGTVELSASAESTAASADAEDDLRMLARLTARGASKRIADGLSAWPARVMRWRGAGRGG